MPKFSCPIDWTREEVCRWLRSKGFDYLNEWFEKQDIDGKALLLLTEEDVKEIVQFNVRLGRLKKLYLNIQQLKADCKDAISDRGYDPISMLQLPSNKSCYRNGYCNGEQQEYYRRQCSKPEVVDSPSMQQTQGDYLPFNSSGTRENSYQSSRSSEDGLSVILKPEFTKTVIALAYLIVVTWITSFVMVIVHDRVPDMKRYPPLPDIFLDNVPYIPWAFHMCEWTATVLVLIWIVVLFFHKHRFILLRRFFALCGTVFLLRCITMLITSLSVPGSHLKCSPRISTHVAEDFFFDVLSKIRQAYTIWRNAGLSIRGVRTCGDYMFSGHSVVLTMLNFFITEYTPRDLHLLHIFTWVLNMFGIFFILSGHEHYSIDVFIAFYITSRLFLYYHTLANNQALMQRDSTRTRIWFPLFSFFEASIVGMVPNEYETVLEICQNLYACLKYVCVKLIFVIDTLLIKSSHAMGPKAVFDQPQKKLSNKRSKKPKNS